MSARERAHAVTARLVERLECLGVMQPPSGISQLLHVAAFTWRKGRVRFDGLQLLLRAGGHCLGSQTDLGTSRLKAQVGSLTSKARPGPAAQRLSATRICPADEDLSRTSTLLADHSGLARSFRLPIDGVIFPGARSTVFFA
ncbi:hypothetical protein B2J93_2699 [Marssonina coronariae]|uniref:Uncharacterized protein n=1 Tax=Diplocarpon coronariae TaxID=2795749 RepID=A0A218Z829_9HELO|nr:hypothetical protein B2J93_2699 [Marssonina coronariae]